MKRRARAQDLCVLVSIVVIVMAISPLSAQPTTTINMLSYPNGVQGPVMGGVYTSPYYATVGSNPNPVPIICDDFLDNTYFGESWTAFVTPLSNLPGNVQYPDAQTPTVPGYGTLDQSQAYDTAAYLALEILHTNQSTPVGVQSAGDLSYALWGLFDPNLFADQSSICPGGEGCLSSADLGNAEADLLAAWQYVRSPANSAAVADLINHTTIYTYDPAFGTSCGGGSCPPPPQEFISVTTPEASTLVLLFADLFAFFLLFGFLRKRALRAI